jgi:D-alanine-D-alanine ligase
VSDFKREIDETGKLAMRVGLYPSEIPVLLLYNLDQKWSAQEQAGVIEVTTHVGRILCNAGYPTTLVPVTSSDLDSVLSEYNPLEFIVFNWCEGLPGVRDSEASVVEYLEQHNYTFTGSTSATLQLASDKCRVKRLLDEAGILTPRWGNYEKSASVNWKNFPAIVKPAREHCSEGIHRNAVVTTETRLKNRIRYVIKRFQHPALVEDFIDGRELHISLWGDGEIEMLPPAEMEFPSFENQNDRVCTYESKFVPESKQYKNIKTVLPAPLGENERRDLEQICKAAYALMGCRDYARIDLRMKDGLFYILDINPNADICPDTSTIAAAEFAGYTYKDFLVRLVLLAAQRHSKRSGELALPQQSANT